MKKAMCVVFLENSHKEGIKNQFWRYMKPLDWIVLVIAELAIFVCAVFDMTFLIFIDRQPIYELMRWTEKRKEVEV